MNNPDIDALETQEWLDALKSVVKYEGQERAAFLLKTLSEKAATLGVSTLPFTHTPYINTIPSSAEPSFTGDAEIEKKITAIIRWNAIVTVLKATQKYPELGGHLASYASAATLYDIGFNHFFKGSTPTQPGDLIYIQGHSSPGIYARAFLEGRITEEQLLNFRQEVDGKGLSSYPHPWLMPDFWQFATVSMGLGPLQAIYQARFLKYLHNRGLANTENRKVWMFCGDGEMDEPESLGAISVAAREKLDNLIFVVNCNLQRLDGPVRGNGKIIQELEGVFKGAGWNAIKVIWGNRWDALLEGKNRDLLIKRMEEAVDGEYQTYKARDGAYVREHFFGKYPELREMVKEMSDEDIWHLNRGGHDPQKVFAAYHAAVNHKGQPTVILAKTVKGYGLGTAGEGQNITHQQKKMKTEELKMLRDRFDIPISDEKIADMPFYKPSPKSPEMQYLKERREALGGYLPARLTHSEKLPAPDLSVFEVLLQSTGDREISTTMAFVRLLNILLKDKTLGPRIVPIIPDECRTFGMEGMFRQYGIYSPVGQLYNPVDSEQLMYYREDVKGQILEEGITEPGSMASWIAAGTSYSTNNLPMIPFYIYYSMFGFQRVGDLAWAAGDMRTNGFLMGGTAGRTTLAGEGLQHQDGHSHSHFGTIPNCITYDPTFSYELAVIIQDGLKRMYTHQEPVFYYITIMNENYTHPEMPKDAKTGILKGMYLFRKTDTKHKMQVQLLGSGTILREVIAAAEQLEKEFSVAANVWSVTSFNELAREGRVLERENRFNPTSTPKQSYVTTCLKNQVGPVIAATDYIRAYADQIRAFVPGTYTVLGTDGFGRSDTRKQLREFFEVNQRHIVFAALKSLADEKQLSLDQLKQAMKKLKI
jgi:pyruvate dehydrogenase E1 component